MCIDLVQKFMGIAAESMQARQYPIANSTVNLAKEIFVNIKMTAKKRLEKIKHTPDLYMHLKKTVLNIRNCLLLYFSIYRHCHRFQVCLYKWVCQIQ